MIVYFLPRMIDADINDTEILARNSEVITFKFHIYKGLGDG